MKSNKVKIGDRVIYMGIRGTVTAEAGNDAFVIEWFGESGKLHADAPANAIVVCNPEGSDREVSL